MYRCGTAACFGEADAPRGRLLQDKRNKLVYLTDEGEAFRRWISPKLSAYYTRLDEILGKDVIKQTEKLLKDLQHAIETY